jgi:hypothetical protein
MFIYAPTPSSGVSASFGNKCSLTGVNPLSGFFHFISTHSVLYLFAASPKVINAWIASASLVAVAWLSISLMP